MGEVVTECVCGELPALTTTELAAVIAASPRFTGEAGAYFDECAARYGLDFTGLAWLQACLKADQDARECDACGAEAGEECRPMCTGQAAAQDAAGEDVTAEAHTYSEEPDAEIPRLVRAHCSCGWHGSGYAASWIVRRWFDQHVAERSSS